VLAGCLAAPLPAGATLVNINFSGTIFSANADTATLFNAGGSALGLGVNGTISYDTASFGTPAVSGAGYNEWDSTDGSLARAAITISLTANGVTLTTDGSYANGLIIADQPGPYAYGNNVNQALEIISEQTNSYGTNVMDFQYVTNNPNATMINPALNIAGPFDLSQALEDYTYFATGWNTPTLSADFAFTTDGMPVPEPASPALLSLALMSLLSAKTSASFLKRRNKKLLTVSASAPTVSARKG